MENISVKHKLIKKNKKILFRKFTVKGYEHFKICLYVEGELSNISFVEYELHPTFQKTNRVSDDSLTSFAIKIWTWGEFEVLVTIHYKTGKTQEIIYDLKYADELPVSDTAYIDETPIKIKEQV